MIVSRDVIFDEPVRTIKNGQSVGAEPSKNPTDAREVLEQLEIHDIAFQGGDVSSESDSYSIAQSDQNSHTFEKIISQKMVNRIGKVRNCSVKRAIMSAKITQNSMIPKTKKYRTSRRLLQSLH